MCKKYIPLNRCLCCKSKRLKPYLDLGWQPLVNNLVSSYDSKPDSFPLIVNVCTRCWHSQLSIAVNPETLFKHYLYVSGTSKTLKDYFNYLSKKILILSGFRQDAKILDIACNDGSFLENFKRFGWVTYGIDPADNLMDEARKRVDIVYNDFFPSSLIPSTVQFDFITALNVFAHISDPHSFLCACKKMLSPNGKLLIQTSQKDMVVNREFDTVYHEHHSFFTINSMKTIVRRAGLYLENVETMGIHGNSYLFTISKKRCEGKFGEKFKEEKQQGRYSLPLYLSFQKEVDLNRNALGKTILDIDLPVVGYGAAAKGIVLSNYFGLTLDYIVDDNPLKQGKFAGTDNVPIYDMKMFENDSRDLAIIILPWNIFDELIEKVRMVRKGKNDVFIKPLPELKVYR